jgi:hypothetical protein
VKIQPQWVVTPGNNNNKLVVFDCRQTSLVVIAASDAARKVVAGLGRRILLHLTVHTAWAHGCVDKPSPLAVFISVI